MAGQMVRVAVVGASTLLGKELLDEISASAPPTWDVQALEPGDEAEGQLTSSGGEALVVHALKDSSFDGLDLVFFASEPEVTAAWMEAALRAGAGVIDLTGSTAGKPGFLRRSPWLENVARPDLTTQGITVPHPAALMVSLVAGRLGARFGVETLSATVLEPASQAGSAGVDELHHQTVSLLSFQDLPKTVFDAQVAFNLLDALGEESGQSLEAARNRMETDLDALLRPAPAQGEAASSGAGASPVKAPPIALNVVHAPVFHGYYISCFAQLQREANEAELEGSLDGMGVALGADTHPSNQAATESGELLLRVRKDHGVPRGMWVVMAADNLRITVRTAVMAAAELAALRPGARVQ